VHDFYGTASLLDEPDSGFDAKVTVDLNRVIIQTDDTEIGAWRHSDLDVKKVEGQVHLKADDDILILELEGQEFFLDLLAGAATETRSSRRQRRKKDPEKGRQKSTPLSLADTEQIAREAVADQIDRRLAIAMGVAALVVLLGAALTWGPFRLLDPGSFPISRLLAGAGGLAGLLGLYLSYFDRNRAMGSIAAVTAGIVTFCIVFLYARAARLGIGFILVLLGSQALIAVGVLGMRDRSDAEQSDS
jgi:hypothetical protein